MNEHISFQELVSFVWMEKLDEETKALAVRVNRHLLTCDDCAETAKQLQSIRARARTLKERQTLLEETNRRVLEVQGKLIPLFSRRSGEASGEVIFSAAAERRPEVTEEGTFPEK